MVVCKANDLVSAKYKLSLEEQRLVLYLISLVDKDDKDFKEYEITVKDFCEFSGFPNDSNFYRHFRSMSDSLLQKRIDLVENIKDENGRIVHLCWLSQTVYYPHKGKISVQFASGLKPYLLQLKDNFTLYDLKNIRSLRSTYSIRIYELLKQYQKLKKRTFIVDDLKAILGVEKKYVKYGVFKQYVILVAQRELLEKCDICFDFNEIKDSRKVVKLEFLIRQNEKNCPGVIDGECTEAPAPLAAEDTQSEPVKPPPAARKKEDFPEYQQKILEQLSFIKEGLSNESRLKIFKAAGGDVDRIRRRYEEALQRGGIDSLGGYLNANVRSPEENFRKIPVPRNQNTEKANRFNNFNQRKNDHAELERMELEQFKRSVMNGSDSAPAKRLSPYAPPPKMETEWDTEWDDDDL